MKPLIGRRALVLTTAVVVTMLGLLGTASSVQAVPDPAPGSPGIPATGAIVYQENFSSGTPTVSTTPVGLSAYTVAGGTNPYTSDPSWAATANRCNGWILNAGTNPPPTSGANGDSTCSGANGLAGADGNGTNRTAWWFLSRMGTAMGLLQGQSAAAAATSNVLASMTNGGTQVAGQTLQFQTTNPLNVQAGHYYMAYAEFAQVHCKGTSGASLNWTNAEEQLTLSGGTAADPWTSPTMSTYPCTDPDAVHTTLSDGVTPVSIAILHSPAILIPPSVDPTTVKMSIRNLQQSGTGNDVAIDIPTLTDVTPQLDKSFSPTVIPLGGTSQLTFTITNTDELAAKPTIEFTDNLPAGLVYANAPVGGTCRTIDPTTGADTGPAQVVMVTNTQFAVAAGLSQDQASCTVTIPVTTSTIGTYTNGPANISGAAGVLAPGTATLQVAHLTLAKTALPTTVEQAGDQVDYTFVVTNDGVVPLNNLAINETAFSGNPTSLTTPACQPVSLGSTLPAGAHTTCTASYTVQQSDVDAGSITNTATATGQNANLTGGSITSAPSNAKVTIAPDPSLSLTKTATRDDANPDDPLTAGQVITYHFTVQNTGNVTLKNLAIDDGDLVDLAAYEAPSDSSTGSGVGFTGSAPLAVTCLPTTLTPQQFAHCTATYTVTAADVLNAKLDNTAQAAATAPDGTGIVSGLAAAEIPTTPHPSIALNKKHRLPLPIDPPAGTAITYDFSAINDGNVTLTDVAIHDNLVVHDLTYVWPDAANPGVLLPGQQVTATATYTLTTADLLAGQLTNTATATGTSAYGDPLSLPAVDNIFHLLSTADVTVSKVADPTVVSAPGPVTYTFTVSNPGSLDLANVVVTDQGPVRGDGSTPGNGAMSPSGPICTIASLPAGTSNSTDCKATYQVTAADIAAGQALLNTASVSAPNPTGGTPLGDTASARVDVVALSLAKSVSPAVATAAGPVTYHLAVTNSGSVALSHLVVTDPGPVGRTGTWSGVDCGGVTTLAVGATTTCTATYQVTAADLAAGVSLFNQATATATDSAGLAAQPAQAGVPLDFASLHIDKTVSPAFVRSAGDTVTYTLTVKNTGTVPVTGLAVVDPGNSGTGVMTAQGDFVCRDAAGHTVTNDHTATLAPGQTVSCTATYQASQGDINAGSAIANTARAQGSTANGTAVVSNNSTVLIAVPKLTLTKSADQTNLTAPGTVTYSFTVANAGSVALSGVTVVDPGPGGTGAMSAVVCAATDLAPGASTHCTATYQATAADIEAGHALVNTAHATGLAPDGAGTIASSPATATVAVTPPTGPVPPSNGPEIPGGGMAVSGPAVSGWLALESILIGLVYGIWILARRYRRS